MTLPPLNVPALLRQHKLRPKKGLGQNFLVDQTTLERVADAAEINPGDTVLEVGPGLGSLTRILAQRARRVVAVEIDANLIPVLEDVLASFDNVTIVQGDMLKQAPLSLVGEPGYKVAANIPYYITSALIRHLLEAPVRPSRVVLTVQKEVAQRIAAPVGKLSLLALGVQVYGAPRIADHIPASAFYPAPDVDSAVVRIDLYPQPRIPSGQIDLFFRLAKAGFGQKRKTLRNSLGAGLSLSGDRAEALLRSAGIDPQRRAETLAIEEWGALVEKYLELSPNNPTSAG